jgi:hypothetical protein
MSWASTKLFNMIHQNILMRIQMQTRKRIIHKNQITIVLFLTAILIGATMKLTVFASELPPPEQGVDSEDQPTLPDLTHQYLAVHAAESHVNTPEQVSWISQGAYDEDHQFLPTFGWHSWDPDTGEFWWSPTGDGPALERANMLFWEAVNLYKSDQGASWMKLGQSLHLLQDMSTPAHAHADSHVCLGGIGDCDAYETWLGVDDLANTWTWINGNPPGPDWNMKFTQLPTYVDLSTDLKTQLEGANLEYGGYSNGEQLWESGPPAIDALIFQLMYLMAETADNYNSGGLTEFPGEFYNGDLDDPAYLSEMRDALLPVAVEFSTAWIDYFEYQVGILDEQVYLPLIIK